MTHIIEDQDISLEDAFSIIENRTLKIQVSEECIGKVKSTRNYLENKIISGKAFYGINTGFGSLYNKSISNERLNELQVNLVRSHACGLGDLTPKAVVRLMLYTKIKSLSRGYSGVQLQTLEMLVNLFNNNLLPVIYDQGSLGASGDLAPLAHMSLPLIGEGSVWENDQKKDAGQMLDKHGLSPITLSSKEGLALINGTQFILSYGIYALWRIERLFKASLFISALSVEAYNANTSPFDEKIMQVRKHHGQGFVAEKMRELLNGSKIQDELSKELQDPYSFRCIPQVLGAVCDTIQYVKSVIEIELNSVTDNPLIFPEADEIISGGNFHAQPLAMPLDSLAIAMAEMGSISERRIFKLLAGNRGLPEFLVTEPGINSGFMIPQYTAASIASQNKQFAIPASIDSIDSSNGQEDHVSMGANSATKLMKVVDNVEKILAIELFTAAQAIDLRKPLTTSKKLNDVLVGYRKVVKFAEIDRYYQPDMMKSIEFIKDYKFNI